MMSLISSGNGYNPQSANCFNNSSGREACLQQCAICLIGHDLLLSVAILNEELIYHFLDFSQTMLR